MNEKEEEEEEQGVTRKFRYHTEESMRKEAMKSKV